MLVVLGIMVLVHEFGHFAVAKLCGVRMELFQREETEHDEDRQQ